NHVYRTSFGITMVVTMDETSHSVLSADNEEFVVEGQAAVQLKFVHSEAEMSSAKGYHPEFVHQHFGDKETIFGYKNLEITLYYTDASMYIYPEIKYDKEISSVSKELKADDIIKLLKDQLPSSQIDMMVSTMDNFRRLLKEQDSFKPFGELLSKFDHDGREMRVMKVTEGSPQFDAYLSRVQTIALWYIDAAQYTDNDDPRWIHYLVYEATKRTDGEGVRYALAGYASVVNFYCYPEMLRPRIAHILLLPQYRRAGNGAKFLQAIYNDLVPCRNVKDITAEDPGESFIHLRDFVDCCNCIKLPEFSFANLSKGFTTEVKDAALTKLKINPRQARRVYEILRLMSTNTADEKEMRAYRIDVKRRLEAPLKKSDRDWRKLRRALDEKEMASVAASQMNIDKKMNLLQQMFDEEIADYKITIDRLKLFSGLF
uniref:Histone acetyltransferase type B catalytic subunit n=2 Tax=Parascaris univalens TaxID=6257 RepID=A0A915BXX6_PARUN